MAKKMQTINNDMKKQIILEYLRNETSLNGMEINTFERKMRERGVW